MQLPRYNLKRQHRVTILLDDAERQTLVDLLMQARSKSASDVLREALQRLRAEQKQ